MTTPDSPVATVESPAASAAPTTMADFTIPDAVQALLDEASVEGGPYAATFTNTAAVLVRADTGAFVRKVDWPHAGQFSRNLLGFVLGAPVRASEVAEVAK